MTVDLQLGAINFLFFFLISYKFTDVKAQEIGAKMLKEWYNKEGHKIDQRGMMLILGFSYLNMTMVSLVDANSIETIWKQWRPWQKFDFKN